MISLTTNVNILLKRLILMIAFIGAIIFGTSVSHAAYIAPPSTIGEAVVLAVKELSKHRYPEFPIC